MGGPNESGELHTNKKGSGISSVLMKDSMMSLNPTSPPRIRLNRHRPPIPIFPPPMSSSSPLKVTLVSSDINDNDNDNKSFKNRSRQSTDHPAYAPLISRLIEAERQDSHPKPRSRSSSSSTNALLRLLARETARADTAEQELAKDHELVLARVKSIKEAQLRTEAELTRTSTELSLYKLQLEHAKREIVRAQAIIEEADHARAEAEEQSIKDRELLRKVLLQRATDAAREQGRREGWKRGMQQGRWETLIEEYADEDSVAEDEPYTRQTKARSQNVRSTTLAVSVKTPSKNRRSVPRNPAAALAAAAAPIPIRPLGVRSDRKIEEPESISIIRESERRAQGRVHQSPPERRSPSLAPSRRSLRSHYSVPPDGYIPITGPNEHISLPPPHELSMPVDPPPLLDGDTRAGAKPNPSTGVFHEPNNSVPRPVSRSARTKSTARSRAGSVTIRPEEDAHYPAPVVSAVPSRASTRISQYDIVSRADGNSHQESTEDNGRPFETASGHLMKIMNDSKEDELTPPQKIAREWRLSNSGYSHESQSLRKTPVNAENQQQTSDELHDASHTLQDIYSSERSERVRSPRVSQGPRPIYSRTVPSSRPKSADPGLYIYKPAAATPAVPFIPPERPSSVANLYRQPTPSTSHRASPPRSHTRATVQRSVSNITVPGIAVESPSPRSPSDSSGKSVRDPVLLTPEHANMTFALPEVHSNPQPGATGWPAIEPIVVDQLPPGFIPLSPIPSLSKLKLPPSFGHDGANDQTIQGGKYQIYAGVAQIHFPQASSTNEPREEIQGMPGMVDSSSSVEKSRDPTESPAPLDRHFSIFSDIE